MTHEIKIIRRELMKNKILGIIIWLAIILIGGNAAYAITVTANPNPTTVYQSVAITVTVTFAGNAPFCPIEINYGDGSIGTFTCTTPSCGRVADKIYTEPGIKTVTVRNIGTGCTLPFTPDPVSLNVVVNCLPLAIVTASPLPSGTKNEPYSLQLESSGGVAPLHYTLLVGSLPPGLVLNSSSGIISGIPTTNKLYSFTIRLGDSCPLTARTTSKAFTLTIMNACAPLVFVTSSPLPSGTINQPYSLQFESSGGQPPYLYNSTGSLPPGLSLNSSAGSLSGVPTQSGPFSFTISSSDDNKCLTIVSLTLCESFVDQM